MSDPQEKIFPQEGQKEMQERLLKEGERLFGRELRWLIQDAMNAANNSWLAKIAEHYPQIQDKHYSGPEAIDWLVEEVYAEATRVAGEAQIP